MEIDKGKKDQVMRAIVESGGLEIRDVDKGEPPFLYSTKNHGPGYVDIKGRVGFDEVFDLMVDLMADLLIANNVLFDLLVGMMTGGAIPGHSVKKILSSRLGKRIVYVYQRGSRKVGGHEEMDTGDRDNPHILPGCRALIFEELVNFAGTTVNGALYERNEKGRIVTDAATILFYQNPVAIKRLAEHKINLHYLIGLRDDLLPFVVREGLYSERLVGKYLEFLADPKGWNQSRGFEFFSGE
jgi:orotate phosphoribosyltransferase